MLYKPGHTEDFLNPTPHQVLDVLIYYLLKPYLRSRNLGCALSTQHVRHYNAPAPSPLVPKRTRHPTPPESTNISIKVPYHIDFADHIFGSSNPSPFLKEANIRFWQVRIALINGHKSEENKKANDELGPLLLRYADLHAGHPGSKCEEVGCRCGY